MLWLVMTEEMYKQNCKCFIRRPGNCRSIIYQPRKTARYEHLRMSEKSYFQTIKEIRIENQKMTEVKK